jgi:hypothetical protein
MASRSDYNVGSRQAECRGTTCLRRQNDTFHSKTDLGSGDQIDEPRLPFDCLWQSQTYVQDNTYLTPLRTHLLRLMRIVANLEYHGGWNAVYFNLHSAASLNSIGLYTDVYADSSMCSSASERDEAFSKVNRHFVSGQLVFQGVWNAFEIAGSEVLLSNSKASTQAVRHKLSSFGHKPIFGFKETFHDALENTMKYIDFDHRAVKESVRTGSLISVSAELLRQFRNGLLHGRIRAIEPSDWGGGANDRSHETQTEIFHSVIRLTLFLLQSIIENVSEKQEMVWPNDGQLVEDLIFGIQKDYSSLDWKLDFEDTAGDESISTGAHCLFPDQAKIEDL